MSEAEAFVYDGMTVDRPTYVVAYVVLTLDSLRERGLVEGGYKANGPGLAHIVETAEARGFAKPTEDEIKRTISELKEMNKDE